MISPSLLAKFRRRAPLMQSQSHLDRAMALFAVEDHEEIATIVQPLLTKPITARKVEPVELKPKDPENPTLQESTVQRLNLAAEAHLELATVKKSMEERIAELEGIVESLKSENNSLKSALATISEPEAEKL